MNYWKPIAAVVALLMLGAIATLLLQSRSDEPGHQHAAPASDLPRFRAGELQVGIATLPETPRVGENTLLLELNRLDGTPLEGATVQAVAEMPAMGAMPAMRAPAGLEPTGPGRFRGTLSLSMRGDWPLTVNITHPNGTTRRLQFDLATDRQGLEIASGGSPLNGSAAADSDTAINVDSRRRQLIGLKTREVTHHDLTWRIRAVGRVAFDERRLSHVTLRFDGFIGELHADFVGAPVTEGQVLFSVYSPDLLAAQEEYLEVLKRRRGGADDPIIDAGRQRLRLWDMPPEEIEALERRGTPLDYVPIRAPRSGTVIERNVAAGGAAAKGQILLSIADLTRVWVEADVYAADLELVKPGAEATVTLTNLPGQSHAATVEYVYPYLDDATRTGRVRLSLDNSGGALKPGMYAEVSLHADIGRRLAVPEEAVIVAGDTRVVFVDLGDGRLNPVRIRTGRSAGGYTEVLEGLSAGDRVVTSGNFLVAAETRLKTGLMQW
jgi:membrane fusion protein, copper/silver efflux system